MTSYIGTSTSRYIGTSTSRVDGRAKVTGGAQYAGEFKAPNLVYASVVTSTIARGRIARIDTPGRLPSKVCWLRWRAPPRLPRRSGDLRSGIYRIGRSNHPSP